MHLSSQRNLARILFWGTQGVQRDVARAMEYYRTGAESQDPVAQFDYGVVLLKV
jgi:TPR repeat protein